MMLALTAAPAAAQSTQEGLENVGGGANVCDPSVLAENDAASEGQCTNTQNN